MKETLNKYKTGLFVIGAGLFACLSKWVEIKEDELAEKRLKDMEDRISDLESNNSDDEEA